MIFSVGPTQFSRCLMVLLAPAGLEFHDQAVRAYRYWEVAIANKKLSTTHVIEDISLDCGSQTFTYQWLHHQGFKKISFPEVTPNFAVHICLSCMICLIVLSCNLIGMNPSHETSSSSNDEISICIILQPLLIVEFWEISLSKSFGVST